MPSERSGLPEPLARLADVLAEAGGGVRPTPRELAELLWLTRHMETPAEPPAPEHPREQGPQAAEPAAPEPAPREPERRPDRAPSPPPEAPRAPLHLPSPEPSPGTTAEPHTSLLAPAPPMLRHPLALQRSLRPLKRRADAPVGQELDERATADRIARLGAAPEWWLPVLRPAQERWLRLNLVYDTGPTMPVWRPLVRELQTVLAQSGVFRTVSVHRAGPDGTVRGHGAHAPTDGRTVTLLISDCMGPQWRKGPAGARWYATLRRWAHRMPVAVVQPLPEHLWRHTALPTAPGRLSAPHPAAPSAALTFTPYETLSYDHDTLRYGTGGTVPLPVLEPGPAWLANWAALLATPGRTEFPGAAALLGTQVPADSGDRTDVTRLSAEELVLRFRATASPEAFRLAGHLALGRPDLPVMRLIQAALDPDPRPQHLAEVILSGMLTSVPGPPGSYAFRPGVRDLLLRSLPRTARSRTTELLRRVGGLIDERAGLAPGEFRASTPAPSGVETAVDGEAFATVSPESVRRLSEESLLAGRYRLVSRLAGLDTHWLAEDTRRDRETVLVRRYPRPAGWLRTGFTDIAERLGQIRHPGIAAVRDYGVEDDVPYLVREFADGRGLDDRLRSSPHGLPADELVALVPPLVDAVDALPHGGLDVGHVVLTPRGPVLTCLDALSFDTATRAGLLRALGNIVSGMYQRSSLPEELGTELDTAVAELASDNPVTQQHGVDRLRHLPPHRKRTLGQETAEQDLRPAIVFEADDLRGHPEARITLEYAVHEVLSRGALAPHQYELHVRGDGYAVLVQPGAYVLPVLVAVLRGFTEMLAGLVDPPRFRVTFWHAPPGADDDRAVVPPDVRAAWERVASDVLLVLSPTWYEEFAASSAAQGPQRFQPLHRSAPDAPPLAWYCPLAATELRAGDRELVAGPFITQDLRQLGVPAPGRTAVVHAQPDGPLTLLDPAQPYGTGPPRPTTYYEVDLTTQQDVYRLSLPSSGKGAFAAAVELSWHVDDPVAYLRGETTRVSEALVEHLLPEAARITRRHPLRRAGAAQRAVNARLRGGWPVPGLSVACSVQLAPEGGALPMPQLSAPRPRRPAALLADAETVLFGFDGPVTRLFSATAARAAALDLLAVVAEHRHPDEALGGRPLTDTGGAPREAFLHPLDVLRAFARHRLGTLLRERLDQLELQAVPDAPTTHNSVALIRALHGAGRRVSVVTDVCEEAVRRYLTPYRLPLAGLHGRSENLGLLMPHPDCLQRALGPHDTPATTGLLIGSSVAELTAAQQVGLRFIGLARNPTTDQALREAGCEVTVPSLAPLLEAARSL